MGQCRLSRLENRGISPSSVVQPRVEIEASKSNILDNGEAVVNNKTNNGLVRGRSMSQGSVTTPRKVSPPPLNKRIRSITVNEDDNIRENSGSFSSFVSFTENEEEEDSNENNKETVKNDMDEEWRLICRVNLSKVVDPSDVLTVIDERICCIINELSPCELLFLQRHVKSLSLEKDNPKASKEKRKFLIDEVGFRKIFNEGDTAIKEYQQFKNRQESITNNNFLESLENQKTVSSSSLSKKNFFFTVPQKAKVFLKEDDEDDIFEERPDLLGSAFVLLSYICSEPILEHLCNLAAPVEEYKKEEHFLMPPCFQNMEENTADVSLMECLGVSFHIVSFLVGLTLREFQLFFKLLTLIYY